MTIAVIAMSAVGTFCLGLLVGAHVARRKADGRFWRGLWEHQQRIAERCRSGWDWRWLEMPEGWEQMRPLSSPVPSRPDFNELLTGHNLPSEKKTGRKIQNPDPPPPKPRPEDQ